MTEEERDRKLEKFVEDSKTFGGRYAAMLAVFDAARSMRNAHAMHGTKFEPPRYAVLELYEALAVLDAMEEK